MEVNFLNERAATFENPKNLIRSFPGINLRITDRKFSEKDLKRIGSMKSKSLKSYYSTYMTDGSPGRYFVTDVCVVFSFSEATPDSMNHASAVNGVGIMNLKDQRMHDFFVFDEDTDKLPGLPKSSMLAKKIVLALSGYPQEKLMKKFHEYRNKYERSIF